jgi:uncharacterized delta-60 repeat protein
VQADVGDLDPAFGDGGKVTTDFSNSVDHGNAVALQRDGRIVVAGSTISPNVISTQHDFALARYKIDGSLDASFGAGGRVQTDFFGFGDEAFAVAVQNDGRIIAAGISGNGGSEVENGDFALARYNGDGSLDPTFGNGGKVTTDFSGFRDVIYAIAIQNDGKILVAGAADFSNRFGLARYDSYGSLDTSFGTGGKVITAFSGSFAFAQAVAIQSNGQIVVSGGAYFDNSSFALARYNVDGSLDASFGSGGKVTTALTTMDDRSFAVAIQTDGKIVAAGTAGFFSRFGLARYNTDGSLDTSFGVGGKVTTVFLDVPFAAAEAHAVIIQNDGKIIVAGAANIPKAFSQLDFALARYNSDGSLDISFGQGGKVANDFFGLGDVASAAVLQGDGRIVLAGTATSINSDFALARYNSDFTITSACKGEGKQLIVNGSAFVEGAKVFLNGSEEKTSFVSSTQMIAKKAGKRAQTGDILMVRNPDGSQTPVFTYTRVNCSP